MRYHDHYGPFRTISETPASLVAPCARIESTFGATHCGVEPLSGNSYDHRRTWIRDRLESLAGLFGVEIAAFAVLSTPHGAARRGAEAAPTFWDQGNGPGSTPGDTPRIVARSVSEVNPDPRLRFGIV